MGVGSIYNFFFSARKFTSSTQQEIMFLVPHPSWGHQMGFRSQWTFFYWTLNEISRFAQKKMFANPNNVLSVGGAEGINLLAKQISKIDLTPMGVDGRQT